MNKTNEVYAFIDSSNVYLSTLHDQNWRLDWKRFRRYLGDKYNVTKAFLFIGYIPKNKGLYKSLQRDGYDLIYKKAMVLPNGQIKGNVDAELVLHAMKQFNNFDKAIIVAGDGDYACLVETLKKENKLLRLIIPNKKKYSSLLTKCSPPIVFLGDLKDKLEFKKKQI